MAEETWTRDPDWVYIPGEDRPVRVEDILPEEPKLKGPARTGGGGGAWVEFDTPKPPRVADHYDNSTEASGIISERCAWWLRQIERGWRPNRRVASECWDCSAEWYGVYAWEFIGPICRALKNGRLGDFDRADAERKEAKRLRTPLGPMTAEEWFAAELSKKIYEELRLVEDNAILYGDGSGRSEEGGPSGIAI